MRWLRAVRFLPTHRRPQVGSIGCIHNSITQRNRARRLSIAYRTCATTPRPPAGGSAKGSRRSCINGSPRRLAGRVPDGRGVGALLGGHRNFRRHLDPIVLGVIRCPARRRDLNDASVVERPLRWIEVRVFPDSVQLGGTNGVRPGHVRHVHGVADGGQFAVRTGLAVAGPGDVIDFSWTAPCASSPAFDDLVAVEVGANGVFEGGIEEGRRFASEAICQITAHRYTPGVADLRQQAVVRVFCLEIPAAKKAHGMRGPVVAYVSRRFMASKSASRVFSVAHTAA